jgi:hypothetical protein
MLRTDACFLVSLRGLWRVLAHLTDIGVLAAMLQGRYVRPALTRRGELQVSCTGIAAAILSFLLLVVLPMQIVRESYLLSTITLYAAATGFAFVSATVVTGLTAAAAACCDEEGEAADKRLRRGRALGGFRSKVSQSEDAKLTIGTTGTSHWAHSRLVRLLDVGTDDLLLFYRRHPVFRVPKLEVPPFTRGGKTDQNTEKLVIVMHHH